MAIPYAGIYREQQAAAELAHKQALAKLNTERGSLFRQYGLQADVDETSGAVSNVRTDLGNQYGAIQGLQRRQGGELNQAFDQASERRIGHRGLGAQQESDLRFEHGGETAELGQNFLGSMGSNYQSRLEAESARAALMRDAEMSALRSAQDNEWFTQAQGTAEGGGGYDPAADYRAPNYIPSWEQKAVAAAYNKPAVVAAFRPGGMDPAIALAAHRKAIAAAATKKPAPKKKK